MSVIESRDLPVRSAMFWDPRHPVCFDERLDTWHAFSHADVLQILNDKATFSSGYGMTEEARQQVNPAMLGMWATDGQRHDDLRAAVAESFRLKMLDWLTPEVRRITTRLMDELIAAQAAGHLVDGAPMSDLDLVLLRDDARGRR